MHRADGAALGTKGTIAVEKARPKARHARLALNLIIDVNSDDNPWPDPYLGEVRTFACSFAPEGWHRCEGELALIEFNTALFSILGNTYGGDGARTFALPDLREAYPVGAATPEQRSEKGGAWPDSDEGSPQGKLLALTYCIAMKGIYPPR
ncbi:MAG: tail fiber protein [Acidobacteria bacterium]|nr:tail fiber protein [Acidobacteriota bacterium]